MRIRWRGLELPSRVQRDESISTDEYGYFIAEPFERGFGTTVGNSLRRILLSSLEGSAVTHARIAGADHEFCTLKGVYQDVPEIILNIKNLVLEVEGDAPRTLRVERTTKGDVRAGDFQCEAGVRIVHPDHLIATLTEDVKFSLELTATRGRGYRMASENIDENMEHGVIAIDSLFSPVTRVRYRTEDTRVGQKTNYDRLLLEIWTKGTVRPEEALVEAAKILRKHLNPFVQYFELGEKMAAAGAAAAATPAPAIDPELQRKLSMSISDLELSVRASNCLEAAKILTVADLVVRNENDLLQLRSFGRTSLDEIKEKLKNIGLELGMKLPPAASTALSPVGDAAPSL
ncbi:MAG: DNA-directed RNA polymerase subunit alpha [Planctomycetota bacterium]|nr:MAG: DNA-directed RNA polymerase subunit alpha [Planctomycetota bacterium]